MATDKLRQELADARRKLNKAKRNSPEWQDAYERVMYLEGLLDQRSKHAKAG